MTDLGILRSWIGGYQRSRPGLNSNHESGDSGVISGVTRATFRTTSYGLKYKNLNFGLWKTVKFEFRPIGIIRKLGGKSAEIREEVVDSVYSDTPRLDKQKSVSQSDTIHCDTQTSEALGLDIRT